MKTVLLLFPDAHHIAEFLVNNRIVGAEVNSKEHSLTAEMEDEEIITAVRDYDAYYKTEIKPRAFEA
ncbi:MAG TPA: hypothetical protein VNT20_23885 [Flavisolibacter sp.]|jgi:hypothetical protein|nr:hypothetical protein [Flavisolibacter sp.]